MISNVLLPPPAICLMFLLFLLQGERVWLWEEEQYLPSTVSSCSGGVVVFATDYGQVCVCVHVYVRLRLSQRVIHGFTARLSPPCLGGRAHY